MIELDSIVTLLVLLQLKHFVLDFPAQPPWMFLNKGKYGHPGGLVHSGLHGVATFALLLAWVPPWLAFHVGIVEAFIHYHVDWLKVQLNLWHDCKPDKSLFWTLLGLDQLLHQLTYLAILYVV